MASGAEIAMRIGGLLAVLFMVYLIIAGSMILALRFRTGSGTKGGFWYTDRTKLKKYIFKSWVDWAGYPAKFSNLASNTAVTTSVFKTLTVKSPEPCMLECDGQNETGKTAKCIGFVYEKKEKSNVCHLSTMLTGFMPSTSNTLYLIDGLDTGKQYMPYTGKLMPSPTYVINTPYRTTSLEQCASNCLSNVECTGFTIDTGAVSPAPNCGLLTNTDPTKFTTGTSSSTIYHLTDHASLTAYPKNYF
jgi:hypothetical protein